MKNGLEVIQMEMDFKSINKQIDDFFTGNGLYENVERNFRFWFANELTANWKETESGKNRGDLPTIFQNFNKKDEHGRTFHGKIWKLFLQVGSYQDSNTKESLLKARDYINLLKSEEKDDTAREVQRLMGVNYYNIKQNPGTDKVYLWLLTFRGWLKSKEIDFDQCIYIFPILFSLNLPYSEAFTGFVSLVHQGKFLKINGQKLNLSLCDITKELIQTFDEGLVNDLYKKHGPPQVIHFQHISSFFTQMEPRENVEIAWDFLLSFGLQFIPFFEAAWCILKRDRLLNGPTLNENEKRDLTNVIDVIRKAVEIYKNTNSDLITTVIAVIQRTN